MEDMDGLTPLPGVRIASVLVSMAKSGVAGLSALNPPALLYFVVTGAYRRRIIFSAFSYIYGA
jgi:hypothetical protein